MTPRRSANREPDSMPSPSQWTTLQVKEDGLPDSLIRHQESIANQFHHMIDQILHIQSVLRDRHIQSLHDALIQMCTTQIDEILSKWKSQWNLETIGDDAEKAFHQGAKGIDALYQTQKSFAMELHHVQLPTGVPQPAEDQEEDFISIEKKLQSIQQQRLKQAKEKIHLLHSRYRDTCDFSALFKAAPGRKRKRS